MALAQEIISVEYNDSLEREKKMLPAVSGLPEEFLSSPSFARLESCVMKAQHKNLGTKHQEVYYSVIIIPVWYWAHWMAHRPPSPVCTQTFHKPAASTGPPFPDLTHMVLGIGNEVGIFSPLHLVWSVCFRWHSHEGGRATD